MTFLELCQRLRQDVGAAGTGPASVSGQSGEYARLIGWIRAAWREIQTDRERWRFAWTRGSISVESAFREYALPEDFSSWDEDTLYLGDRRLRVIPWETFREQFRTPDGEVRCVSVAPDNTLRLNGYPDADGTLEFEYWRTPQELTEGTDVPRLPSRYHMAIVYRAMIEYGFYENAAEVIQQGRRGYESLANAMEISELPEMELAGPLA